MYTDKSKRKQEDDDSEIQYGYKVTNNVVNDYDGNYDNGTEGYHVLGSYTTKHYDDRDVIQNTTNVKRGLNLKTKQSVKYIGKSTHVDSLDRSYSKQTSIPRQWETDEYRKRTNTYFYSTTITVGLIDQAKDVLKKGKKFISSLTKSKAK